MDENQGIWKAIFFNGNALLGATGLSLVFSGGFALFLTFSGTFLPHDAKSIGFTASELSLIAPNLVKFMFHDRAAFGGVLMAIGVLYLWLAAYPLANRSFWAWKTFLISGILGFSSFLLYVGYGYLDWWHGVATLCLLPVFILGLVRSREAGSLSGKFRLLPAMQKFDPRIRDNWAIGILFLYAGGLILGGLVISAVGVTAVFVPQDLDFIGLCAPDIDAISSQLLGVIAHDRAGFGGGLLTTGVTVWLILANAPISRSLWDVLVLSGALGFICAIGIHFYVGYTDLVHLLPAYLGASIFLIGILLARKDWSSQWPT